MSWQTIILLQICFSSVMTLFTRHIAISTRRVFLGFGVLLYFGVFVTGTIISLINNHGLPPVPQGIAWTFLLIEGAFIPASWLLQYKLIGYVGASNAVVISVINTLGAALMGILFLGDPLTIAFMVGTSFIISSVFIALRIEPDTEHHRPATFNRKLLVAIGAALLFMVGIFFEKKAINSIGVWNYAFYGWGLQFMFATIYFILFGRHELRFMHATIIKKGLLLGLLTSVAGALYIDALSKGTLSHTVVAISGKIGVTMLLAALLLHERNAIRLRLLAFFLSTLGILFIVF